MHIRKMIYLRAVLLVQYDENDFNILFSIIKKCSMHLKNCFYGIYE